MTSVTDRKSFIHAFVDTEIPMEFVVKFDKVLAEMIESTFFMEQEEMDDYNSEWDHDLHYTDAEVFAEKYSDF